MLNSSHLGQHEEAEANFSEASWPTGFDVKVDATADWNDTDSL